MTLALDTDVLIHWKIRSSPHHQAVRSFLERELRTGTRLGLSTQVIFEFLHVTTDAKRFSRPLSNEQARQLSKTLWESQEVHQLSFQPGILPRVLELMDSYKLGRKRILDTALAATLESEGIERLATLNGRDFQIFPFLRVETPS